MAPDFAISCECSQNWSNTGESENHRLTKWFDLQPSDQEPKHPKSKNTRQISPVIPLVPKVHDDWIHSSMKSS